MLSIVSANSLQISVQGPKYSYFGPCSLWVLYRWNLQRSRLDNPITGASETRISEVPLYNYDNVATILNNIVIITVDFNPVQEKRGFGTCSVVDACPVVGVCSGWALETYCT